MSAFDYVRLGTPNLYPRGTLASLPAPRTIFEAQWDRLERMTTGVVTRTSIPEESTNESSNLT